MQTPKSGGRYTRTADGEIVPKQDGPVKPNKPAVSPKPSDSSAEVGKKSDNDTPKEAD